MGEAMDPATNLLPEGALKAVFGALGDDETRRAEFVEGVDKRLHFLALEPGPHAEQELLSYVRNWVVEVVLTRNPIWLNDVAESEASIAAGAAGDPVTGSELRELLRR
jgi:hypothetical protein